MNIGILAQIVSPSSVRPNPRSMGPSIGNFRSQGVRYEVHASGSMGNLFRANIIRPITTNSSSEIDLSQLSAEEIGKYAGQIPTYDQVQVKPESVFSRPGTTSVSFVLPLGKSPEDMSQVAVQRVRLQRSLWALVMKSYSSRTNHPESFMEAMEGHWNQIRGQVDQWMAPLVSNPEDHQAMKRVQMIQAKLDHLSTSGDFKRGDFSSWVREAENFSSYVEGVKVKLFGENSFRKAGVFDPDRNSGPMGDIIPEREPENIPGRLGDPLSNQLVGDDVSGQDRVDLGKSEGIMYEVDRQKDRIKKIDEDFDRLYEEIGKAKNIITDREQRIEDLEDLVKRREDLDADAEIKRIEEEEGSSIEDIIANERDRLGADRDELDRLEKEKSDLSGERRKLVDDLQKLKDRKHQIYNQEGNYLKER